MAEAALLAKPQTPHRGASQQRTAARTSVVLKFGSSVAPSERELPRIVSEIRSWRESGHNVVAVVSAIGGATDALLAHAQQFGATGKPGADFALAAYVATGEAQAVALLGLALARAGVDAHITDAAGVSLRTQGPPLDASPVSLDRHRVEEALAGSGVVVLPGFVGRDELGRTTLLGRGGSDLTALFIAHQLGARCRLVKDVDGLYDRDPASAPASSPARRFDRVTHDAVLALDEGIVQHKGVRYARDHGLSFEVAALGRPDATLVTTS